MSDGGQSGLLAVFLEEASEGLVRLGRELLALESAAAEERPDRVRDVFRIAHTLKGAASAAGVEQFAEVAHELETCLDEVRRGELQPDRAVIDAALAASDLLHEALERTLEEDEIDSVRAGLRAVRTPASAPVDTSSVQQSAPDAVTRLFTALSEVARGVGGEERLREIDAILEGLAQADGPEAFHRIASHLRDALAPDLARGELPMKRIESALLASDFLLSALSGFASDEEASAIEALLGQPQTRQEAAAPTPASMPDEPQEVTTPRRERASTMRVPTALLDTLSYRVDELIGSHLRLERQRKLIEECHELLERSLIAARSHAIALPPELETVRRRQEAVLREMQQELHGLGVLHQLFQEDLKEVRMVPVGPVLEPYRRMVRDLAHGLGKEVTLELEGEHVRIDKRLLEMLRDPLLHLLRNAVDHGIEPAEQREQAGKPRRGRILLAAASREGQVFLDLSDDGGGIDAARVKEVAIERGLLTPEAAEKLGEQEAIELVFQPGFSTSRNVTSTSGRGVGLDVVRENLVKLGGRLEVRTFTGRGTRFQLSLPLTLAASRGLLVEASRQLYCLPAGAVDEVLTVEPQEIGAAQGQLVLERRGRALPFYRLDDLLAGRPLSRPARHGFALVIVASDKRLVLGVDELHGQEEVVVKGLAPGTPRLPLVSGATTLADGRLVTVLDPAALFFAAQGSRAAKSGPAGRKATVLVVDDALTSRTLLASVLERAGMQTVLAADGEAALASLTSGDIDLVVTDLEMPNLDGIGLVRRIRAHPQWSTLPVVMVSSLGSAEDRARGAEAGADAYVVKRDFDPAKFVELVRTWLGEEASS